MNCWMNLLIDWFLRLYNIVTIITITYFVGRVNGWPFNPDFYQALLEGRLTLSGGLVFYETNLESLLVETVCAKLIKLPAAKNLA